MRFSFFDILVTCQQHGKDKKWKPQAWLGLVLILESLPIMSIKTPEKSVPEIASSMKRYFARLSRTVFSGICMLII